LLSSWGVRFDGIDVEASPERLDDLKRLGIPLVPATVVGGRWVHGWNPKALAELVGIAYTEGERLSPAALARRLDAVLEAAQRAIRQVPAGHLGMKAPDRDRTVRQLAFHVFRLSAAFVDTREQGHFPESWLLEDPPPEMQDGAAIAAYGQRVRDRIEVFVRRPGWCDGPVNTYYGAQPAHELMERTTWHAAQHLRQLYWFLERMRVAPERPLTDDDLAGLPFPKAVWS
jgi:hypothetical protein